MVWSAGTAAAAHRREAVPLLSHAKRPLHLLGTVALFALLGLVAVGLVWPSNHMPKVLLKSADKSSFPLKKVVEKMSANGKPCWACPCCNGCEKSGAAKAAGCGTVDKKAAKSPTDSSDRTSSSDPAFSPVQQQLVKTMIDSELEEHGLNVYKNGNKLTHMGVTVVPGDYAYNRTVNSSRALAEHHMFKRVGAATEEDVLQPAAFGGKDWFERPTRYNDRSQVTEYQPWEDPSGVWQENPVDQAPWSFAESRHWDRDAPEAPDASWEEARGKKLQAGTMTRGAHKKWGDVPNPQWGWEHQFANWDPDGDDNQALVFGAGASKYEAPPWELSFVDPRLYGDDFVPEGKTHAAYQKPVNNQFADWVEAGAQNQDLVFGRNSDTLRQRSHLPVGHNWNAVMDSKVGPDEVKRQLGLRGADVTLQYPSDGSPASHFFSEWDRVPSHKQHVTFREGDADAPLADSNYAGAPPPPAQPEAAAEEEGEGTSEREFTPDEKRGFINS